MQHITENYKPTLFNRITAERYYTITPLYEQIPPQTHLESDFQHCLKRKGSSGSCVNLQLNKAVGLYSSFQRDECEMPKSALHTLLGEESELKQHDCVLKPRKVVHSSRTLVFAAFFESKPNYNHVALSEI